jgi:hypothetical protein
MKNHISKNTSRTLSIAASTKGFGFAVTEGEASLVEWGVKTFIGDKNVQTLIKVADIINRFEPDLLVLEDYSAKGSRRSARIKALGRKLSALAGKRQIKVTMFSREQVMRHYFGDVEWTKHALAEIIAKRFPEELGHRLPPKRKAWMSQDSRMDIFDAVALGLMRVRN